MNRGSTLAERFGLSETTVFLASVSVIAIHVVDDNFLQPEPGTQAADHLRSGLIPLGVLVVVMAAYPLMRAGLRAVCSLLVGAFGLAAASEAVYYTREIGASGDDFTGWLCIPAGLVLLGLGLVILWRSRKRGGRWYIRYGRRLALGVAALLVGFFVVYPMVGAYTITHVITATVPDPDLGTTDYEDVTFTTSDGLELKGWYVPSRNRAAVIVFPGRDGKQDYARMLAPHGYGVLIFDRRGEGASDGDPNLLGWGGDRDIKAAVEFLQSRPDVDSDRIGGIGLSVGGELMMEAASESDDLQAVVTDGAGARSIRETRDRSDAPWAEVGFLTVFTGATWLFSNESVPPDLTTIVADISPTPVLFIYGEDGQPQEIDLTRTYYEAAGEPKQIWEVPGATHINGIDAQPEEYERQVVGFFDSTLLD